ncbi:MAG TPA: hypothetical protein VE093_42175 [Polyangiaceae bacterium]|jgi:hypothetical protein|nr:hypothetical protein [Polyangiaceae bacterium]
MNDCFEKAMVALEEAEQFYRRGGALGAAMPAGIVVAFAGEKIPEGWELCENRAIDGKSTKYKAPSEAIGATYADDDGRVLIPDCREMFLRGVQRGAQHDPGSSSRGATGGVSSGGSGPPPENRKIDASTGQPQSASGASSEAAGGGENQGAGAEANPSRKTSASGEPALGLPKQPDAQPKSVDFRFIIKL